MVCIFLQVLCCWLNIIFLWSSLYPLIASFSFSHGHSDLHFYWDTFCWLDIIYDDHHQVILSILIQPATLKVGSLRGSSACSFPIHESVFTVNSCYFLHTAFSNWPQFASYLISWTLSWACLSLVLEHPFHRSSVGSLHIHAMHVHFRFVFNLFAWLSFLVESTLHRYTSLSHPMLWRWLIDYWRMAPLHGCSAYSLFIHVNAFFDSI